MITITNAYTQRGWSGNDHLIDDSALVELVGRDFAHLGAAIASARPKADARGFLTLEFVGPDGLPYRLDDSPSLPGRDVQRVRRL